MRVFLIELTSESVDSMTLRSVNILSSHQKIIYEKGISSEVLSLINKKARKFCFSTDNELNDLLHTKMKREKEIVVLFQSEREIRKSLEILPENVEVEWLPCVKPYLYAAGINKTSVTKRGTNTSFLVIKEKMETFSLQRQLKWALEYKTTLVIYNNTGLIKEILKFLIHNNYEDIPIAIIRNHEYTATPFEIGTLRTFDNLFSLDKKAIVLIGETIRHVRLPENKELVGVF